MIFKCKKYLHENSFDEHVPLIFKKSMYVAIGIIIEAIFLRAESLLAK